MAVTAPASGPAEDRDPPVTSTHLAEYMNTSVPQPDTMARPVAASLRLVESRCGPVVDTQWTYLVSLDPAGFLRPMSGPLGSVDALVDPDGVDRVDALDASRVNWTTAIIRPTVRRSGQWAVTVTTRRDTGSDDLIEAVLVIAKHLWSARRGSSVRPRDVGMGSAPMVVIPEGFAVPARAAELMADHLLDV